MSATIRVDLSCSDIKASVLKMDLYVCYVAEEKVHHARSNETTMRKSMSLFWHPKFRRSDVMSFTCG